MDGQLYGEDREELSYLWFNELDREKRRLAMDLSFFVRQEDGRYKKFTERHVQTAHDEDALRVLLTRAGFVNVRALPGPQGKQRLYMFAERPSEAG